MQQSPQTLSLKLHAHAQWLSLVPTVVEQGASVFGLERATALRLRMAAEELVAHLAETAPGTEIRLTLESGGWCVRADFSFEADPSSLWAMNLASKPDLENPGESGSLGLLLASRMVDGFRVRLDGRVVHLTLRQDREYPEIAPVPATRAEARGACRIVAAPEPALIKQACTLALNLYPAHQVHKAFVMPGKVVDMAVRGDLSLAVAVDESGSPAGLICWRSPSERSVSFYGPYVLAEGCGAADVLENHLLNTVARTTALGLFSDLATADLITTNYEPLGYLPFANSDAHTVELDLWYRHLREDQGCALWVHPAMRDFMEKTCRKLVLMRDIRETDGQGETLPRRSVFSATLRPDLYEASLAPMVVGDDAAEAVEHHVRLLREEHYLNIFFRLDLAYGWQAALGGVLMDNGFVPRLILPYAGKSDVVVFQHV